MDRAGWDVLGFVLASQYRKSVVRSLSKKPRTPKDIATESKFHLSHVSNTLRELENQKLVKCLTPNRRKGKIFSLTKFGREIAGHLEG